MKRFVTVCAFWVFCIGNAAAQSPTHDLVIYGGASAAITAAVQAKRMGKSVIVVEPLAADPQDG